MKLCLLVLVFSVLDEISLAESSCEALSKEQEDFLFQQHITKFGIKVKPDEKNDFKARFITNHYLACNHNEEFKKGNATYEQFNYKHCHLPYDEFVKSRGGITEGPKRRKRRALYITPASKNKIIPSSFSWVEMGAVTPVQDQHDCDACYIFAPLAAVESHIAIKHGKLVKLSEQDIIDCAKFPYKVGYGCDGGPDNWLYDHLKLVKGTTLNSNHPFNETDLNQCVLNRPRVPESAVSDFVSLPPYDEENMKYHLATVGPIAATMWMSPSFLRYKSGIYEDTLKECEGKGVNHAVLVVGYGSAPCNGRTSCDYWLLKNSWGTQWGEEGYVRWMRNNKNMCNIARSPRYPIV